MAGGAGGAPGVRQASAPVTDVNLFSREDNIKGRKAHVPKPQHPTGDCVQFRHAVGQIQHYIEPFAVGREGDAGGYVGFAVRGCGRRQRNAEQGQNFPCSIYAENFDIAFYIRQIEPRAIRREHQSGEAKLALLFGFEILLRNWAGPRFFILPGGELHALKNLA